MSAWIFTTVIALSLLGVQAQSPDPEVALLRRSDIGAFAPESFRATLVLTSLPGKERHEIEVWRSGRTKTLVRMLDPKERGKFLLRLGDDMWFISPSAKKPVKLNAAYRLYGGATLDEVLGVRLSEAYGIEATTTPPPNSPDRRVTFVLYALRPQQLFQLVTYVVDRSTSRPISATYRVGKGKDATKVDFLQWSDEGGVLYAKKLVVWDLLRKATAATDIEVRTVDPRPVPDALFRLDDGTARRALDAKTP